MAPAIAIVGMACRYPDALSPSDLWETALAQRRAFRRIPSERLRLEDYFSEDPHASDSIYPIEAALIEGYDFDRISYRVAGSTFRSADLAHWLALDIAAKALADAGFVDGEGIPRTMTGVVLGNTMTGEFSRANVMRLRWPYVRRTIEPSLINAGWSAEQCRTFLEELETAYKAPFPPVGEETLAGSLSNTIAGRICNHFDLKGGCYTVDGACASSLLAVATACSGLLTGDLDMAIAGGVDLSLDPFELVGFARTLALAPGEMTVYDARSSGFWPGEGCGFVVLMRHEDAISQGRRVYATIRGWGISSDGGGGITRPEIDGQLLALHRAYRRAGFGIETVAYIEGHGTGTSVGDSTELRALTRARRESGRMTSAAAISSIKANIGHTKAAAGVAGLIKATMALHTQILPPATACKEPHPELKGDAPALRVLSQATPWPSDCALRAGVSAMGFGGINTHLVLESDSSERRKSFSVRERAIVTSAQDAELFLLAGRDSNDLLRQVEHLLTIAARLSRAELSDLAARLESSLEHHQMRAALVSSTPSELADQLYTLKGWLSNGMSSHIDSRAGIFLSDSTTPPRIGFLFPGQGSPAHLDGGSLRRRFEFVEKLYSHANLPESDNSIATEVAQPAIITASLAGLKSLDRLRISSTIALGHSLGELAALHWAGGFDEETLLRIAYARGKAMAQLGSPTGAMVNIRAGRDEVEVLMNGNSVVIACLNSPMQTVISGEAEAIAGVVERAHKRGLTAVRLPVSHAFHSPQVKGAVPALEKYLRKEEFYSLNRPVVSTVTGAFLSPATDLKALLCNQITSPVRLQEAAIQAARQVDMFIEVGPGQVLTGLLSEFIDIPIIAIDAGGASLKGLLKATGAAFALGTPIDHATLFAGRFTKPFDLDWHPRFFENPCELALAPVNHIQGNGYSLSIESRSNVRDKIVEPIAEAAAAELSPESLPSSFLEFIRQSVARRAELPASVVKDDNRLLSDLHLNSITVSQLIIEAARHLGLRRPLSPTDYADATILELACALEEMKSISNPAEDENESRLPAGVDNWVRSFTVEMIECPLPRIVPPLASGPCQIIAPPDHLLGARLQEAFEGWDEGTTVIVCLPPHADEQCLNLLMRGARMVLDAPQPGRFILVQHGRCASSFAKTLFLETPDLTCSVIDVPQDIKAVNWVLAEVRAASGFTEAYYDSMGQRYVPRLRLLDSRESVIDLPIDSSDVVLVTGGGKGITAECALSLAQETGASLILIGLSEPDADKELADNLRSMAAAGIRFQYIAVDVTDEAAVKSALSKVQKTMGAVTGIIHGAAVNTPQLLRSMDEESFHRVLAPKIHGARNVLAAVDCSRLRNLIMFSSVIARTGLPGEAHYGLANEWLTRLTEQFQTEHPDCRCLAIEWSVWSGVGMAQRMGGIDRLIQAGIMPITPQEGIATLRSLLAYPPASASVVVTGRYAELPTLEIEQPDLPLMRFLEKPRVFYPGVELITDVKLSSETDPYITDHVYKGERLFPAVVGLEAMAQAAIALTGSTSPFEFMDVMFNRRIVIPEGESLTIRVAALARQHNQVEVALRSEETGFQIDHFTAIVNFNSNTEWHDNQLVHISHGGGESKPLPIDPERDLYGEILFHKGRFRRLHAYRWLKAKECLAELSPNETTEWFGRYLPSSLTLGDPAARDAAIHAIQACIPHATLLPIGVDRVEIRPSRPFAPGFVRAREIEQEGSIFVYDMEMMDADGQVVERWHGLRLRAVEEMNPKDSWVESLLIPYIERRTEDLIPGSDLAVVIEVDHIAERRVRSDRAIERVIGKPVEVARRFDGKPVVVGENYVSAAHSGDITLAVAASGAVGCDVELIQSRAISVWHDLLGSNPFKLAEAVTQQTGIDLDTSATQVWTALECLKKVGASPNAPIVLASTEKDGWVKFRSGLMEIATCVTAVKNVQGRLAFGMLTNSQRAFLSEASTRM